jgi:hypothetical protein
MLITGLLPTPLPTKTSTARGTRQQKHHHPPPPTPRPPEQGTSPCPHTATCVPQTSYRGAAPTNLARTLSGSRLRAASVRKGHLPYNSSYRRQPYDHQSTPNLNMQGRGGTHDNEAAYSCSHELLVHVLQKANDSEVHTNPYVCRRPSILINISGAQSERERNKQSEE